MFIYLSMIESEEDKSKFERLYLTYRQQMYYSAKRILKDDYLAEDAVHLAFIKIIEHLEKINEEDCHKTKGFIVIVVEHIAIDLYNKRSKEDLVFLNRNDFDTVQQKQESSVSDSEDRIEALRAELPLNFSTVLRFKFSHGYSNLEISKILGISEENVRQRILRGKKHLSKLLNEGMVNA